MKSTELYCENTYIYNNLACLEGFSKVHLSLCIVSSFPASEKFIGFPSDKTYKIIILETVKRNTFMTLNESTGKFYSSLFIIFKIVLKRTFKE